LPLGWFIHGLQPKMKIKKAGGLTAYTLNYIS